MANALICDRCGKVYSPSIPLKIKDNVVYLTATLKVSYLDDIKEKPHSEEDYWSRDLCHECTKKFDEFMIGESNE